MGAKAAIVLVRRVRLLLCPKSFGELKIMFNLPFPPLICLFGSNSGENSWPKQVPL